MRQLSKNEIIEFSLGESVIRLKEEYGWILEVFPCIGNIYKTGKSLVAVRNMIFAKKTVEFFDKVMERLDEINPKEIDKRKRAIKYKEKWIERELEQLIIYIDRYDDDRKTSIFAELYLKLLKNEIEWEDFLEMASMLDRAFYQDLKYLLEIKWEWEKPENCNYTIKDTICYDFVRCDRLASSGFLFKNISTGLSGGQNYEMTKHGEVFCEIMESASIDDSF